MHALLPPLHSQSQEPQPLQWTWACRARDPLKWPCLHPLHLQSAFSVQEVGLDPRGSNSEKGLCQPAPLSPSAPPSPPLTLFMLRPEFLLDLVRGRPVCVQFSSTQWHSAVLTLALCVQVQERPLSRGQRPCLEREQGGQPGPLLHSAAAAGQAGVQVAGGLCAGAVSRGGAAGMAGGHKPPRVQPLPVGRGPGPRQKLQGLGSLQGRVLLCVPAPRGRGKDDIGVRETGEFTGVSAGARGFQHSWSKRQREKHRMRAVCFWARCKLLHPHPATALLTWDNMINKYSMSAYCVPCSVLGGTGDIPQ